jgi:hypothetical protein
MDRPDENETEAEANVKPGGCCCGDPHSSLPAELRPKPCAKNDGLHQVTCPGCGLTYWSNRKTDVCVTCENAGRR